MKKRLLFALMALALMITMTGCPAATEPADTDTTTTAAPITTTTAPITTTTTAPVPDDTFVYESELFPFSLVLPKSWDGAFTVRESEADHRVSFYELQNHLENSQGCLFTVRFLEEHVEGMFPSYTCLGQFGEDHVMIQYPSDVQYIDSLSEPYLRMQEDIDEIVASFTYLG